MGWLAVDAARGCKEDRPNPAGGGFSFFVGSAFDCGQLGAR